MEDKKLKRSSRDQEKRGKKEVELRDEYEEKVVKVNRVSKKTKGGNKIGFSVVVVVGNKKGLVGVGLGKAGNVLSAIKKGSRIARRNIKEVPMKGATIAGEVLVKTGAARVLLKPARRGRGIIAGGVIRIIMELAGVRDVVTKSFGTRNILSNARATMEAIDLLRRLSDKKQSGEI